MHTYESWTKRCGTLTGRVKCVREVSIRVEKSSHRHFPLAESPQEVNHNGKASFLLLCKTMRKTAYLSLLLTVVVVV